MCGSNRQKLNSPCAVSPTPPPSTALARPEHMAGDVAATPQVGKYAYLKGKLIEVYCLTDDQKADRLLDLAGLGDWKPSQLCAHIQSLAVDKDALLRRIFLRQLPEDVRVQIAALNEGDLPALARKVDTQGRRHHG